MYKHTAEAVVCVPQNNFAMKGFRARVREYCRSIRHLGMDRIFDFGDARAILRPVNEGLYIRVEAQEIVTFYGIRALLQANLSTITPVPDGAVEWHPAGNLSFGAIGESIGNQQKGSTGT